MDQSKPAIETAQPSFNKQSNSVEPDLPAVLNLDEALLNDADERDRVSNLLSRMSDPFAKNSGDMGCTHDTI